MSVDKTWVVTSAKPRASHEAIDGEVVPYGDPFSNGLRYPGDPSGGPDETVNCSCVVLISGEVEPLQPTAPLAPPAEPADLPGLPGGLVPSSVVIAEDFEEGDEPPAVPRRRR